MSLKGAMYTALWTEIRAAIMEDFKVGQLPLTAPPALAKVVRANADYMLELERRGPETW